MRFYNKISLLLFSILNAIYIYAQPTVVTSKEKSFMYSNGKIYVVMAVVILIVAGLFLYLFRLDKKISKLEKSEEK